MDAYARVAEAVWAGVVSVKDAWDNLDSGLKQWIVMGVSMAVSFIPVVGPLISCIIDGTFVDMINALSTGDWATLGMCALAFVPGVGGAGKFSGKLAKAFDKIDNLKGIMKTKNHIQHAKDLGMKGLTNGGKVRSLSRLAKSSLKEGITDPSSAKFYSHGSGIGMTTPLDAKHDLLIVVHPNALGGRGAIGTCEMVKSGYVPDNFKEIGVDDFVSQLIGS